MTGTAAVTVELHRIVIHFQQVIAFMIEPALIGELEASQAYRAVELHRNMTRRLR